MELYCYDGGAYGCIGEAERANAAYRVDNIAFRGKPTELLRRQFVALVNGAHAAARTFGRMSDLRFCLRDGLAARDYEFTHQNALTSWNAATRYGG